MRSIASSSQWPCTGGLSIWLISSCFLIAIVTEVKGEISIDFNRDVRPILANHCFRCHGFDASARKGGVRLDASEGFLQSDSGARPIVAGNPNESEVVARIHSTDPATIMPPPDAGKQLSETDKQILVKWIAEGAPYAKHWAFSPPVVSELPAVGNEQWHPIDRFVEAELQSRGLTLSAEADRTTLARRLALDITGLPPDPDVLQQFLSDPSEASYDRYVDHLLNSPRFGERWARPWLDIARFADTKGYEKDLERTMWRWRDWLIHALNEDRPYDQFTAELLAGDLLPSATRDQILATAFHRNTMVNDEGGTDDEEFRVAAVKDRIDTTMQAWMGLSFGCAKCHTHKYDPISIQEYYQFYAFFNQTADADRYDDEPKQAMPTPQQEAEQNRLQLLIANGEKQLKTPTAELTAAFPAWEEEALRTLRWKTLEPSMMVAGSGSTLQLQPDRSILAQASSPEKETYILKFPIADEQDLHAIRLETIPDASHPRGGVGRAANDGNFVLTGIRATLRSADGKLQELKFRAAQADFSQENYSVESVLNNPDPKKKGWAVSPKQSQGHIALFSLESPSKVLAGSELHLVLDHQFEFSFPGFSIGRFRISVTNDPQATLQDSIPDSLLAVLAKSQDLRSAEESTQLYEFYAASSPLTLSIRNEIAQWKSELAAIKLPMTPIMRELPAEQRRVTKLHQRGSFLDPGEEVQPATPSVFPPMESELPKNRLGVAKWLTSRGNPLTARVAVNRIWSQLWGRGIVATEEDFGIAGEAPSHPQLLDWLALNFIDSGWSNKQLIKTIVRSRAYRQSSRTTADILAKDPENRFYSRGARFRLEAEMIRDQALAVSGLLSSKIGGPSVMPYQPEGLWKSTYNYSNWVTSPGEDRHRRGIYTFIKRTTPYPQMITFDGTSRETCTIRRIRTNTPLQALVTLNDPVFVECAQALAREMARSSPAGSLDALKQQIRFGFRKVLLREPSEKEIDALIRLYDVRYAAFVKDPEGAKSFSTEPLGALPENADTIQYAALTAVANVLLNLDEFLVK